MKISQVLILTCTLITILSACAFHKGSIVSNIPDQPVEHRDMAIGVATTVKVFGIGSTNKDALVREAQQRMVINRPLSNSEAYNNIVTDVKTTVFLFVSKQKVTMTADIISPKEDISGPTYTEKYLEHVHYGQSIYDTLFSVGDSVVFHNSKLGEVIGFQGASGKRLQIQYTDEKGNSMSKIISAKSVFVLVSHYEGNRTVRVENGIGPLIAFGVKSDLYRNSDGSNYEFSIRD